MTFIARVKTIDTAALRAHAAFPLIVIGWMVLLFGAAAYLIKGGLLYALLGAIAGGLVGRYLVTRMASLPVEPEEDPRPESERDKRLRRVLGPDSEDNEGENEALEEDPDADLTRILASREPRPEPVFEEEHALIESENAQDEPQYLTIEELQLAQEGENEGLEEPEAVSDFGSSEEPDDESDDGSDDFGPPEAPEWTDPGAALAAMRNSNQSGSVDWESYGTASEPENAYDAYDGWTVEDGSAASGQYDAEGETEGHSPAEDPGGEPADDLASELAPELPVEASVEAAPEPAPQAEGQAEVEPAPQPQPDPEPESVATVAAEPGEHAAAKLRSQDLSQMSLVQMIERLAFAMDDYREAQVRNSVTNATPSSEPAPEVAEALRALPVLSRTAGIYATDGNAALDVSTREQAEATEDALREALEKLQRLSGG